MEIKVLHLGKFCPPKEGGIETFTTDLLGSLNDFGIKADLLCFGDTNQRLAYKNFNVFSCKTKLKINSAPISLSYVINFLKISDKYDIIHVHSPNPIAEFVSLFSPKPVIVHWHSDIVKQKLSYPVYKPIQRLFLKKAKKIIGTSPEYVKTSQQLSDFLNKVVVIPLGINFSKLECRPEFIYHKDVNKIANSKGKIVLSVGRLVEYKGFEYLIESFKYINDDRIFLLIIGDGILKEKLEKKVEREKLSSKIIFLGKVPEVAPYMQISDIFCLPSISRNEAFGVVLLEALYFGKPLITTSVVGSGMNYVNINNYTGLIVPPKNPKELAKAITTILNNKELYTKFSLNAKERVKEFDIKNIAANLVDIYNQVLAK